MNKNKDRNNKNNENNKSLLIAAKNNAIRTNHIKAGWNKIADVGYVVLETKQSIP